jgi:membrane protease YdiL (CAAX protease family)
MKKCPYCGKEYPDEVVRCLMDGEFLAVGEAEPSHDLEESPASAAPPSLTASMPTGANPTPGRTWTDRQTRIIELTLVCAVAFGSGILSSAHHLSNLDSVGTGVGTSPGGSMVGPWNWVNSVLHDGASLGLLWYVLMRRSRTFSDLGLSWVKKDFGWSILLFMGANLAAAAVAGLIALSGLASASHSTSVERVSHYLFGGGITFAAILVQFLNPFFEELIVRAYVMTELKQLTNSASKAILFSTLLQMSYHFYQGVPLALSVGAMFLVFSIYYSKTNRILPIILAHLYADVGATLLYLLHPR